MEKLDYQELLPSPKYNCWQNYVRACKLLHANAIKRSNITAAEYCEEFQHIFGNESCTMNMHKDLHLMQCIFDYGPIYGFWCFPFECFHGQLESYHANNKKV